MSLRHLSSTTLRLTVCYAGHTEAKSKCGLNVEKLN